MKVGIRKASAKKFIAQPDPLGVDKSVPQIAVSGTAISVLSSALKDVKRH